MDNKKRTFLLAVPLLVLGTAVGLGWLRRRRELEDMPMTRIRGPQESPCPCRSCGCGCSGELTATLELQTQLLYDILGAVNALTAAQLSQHD